MYDFNIGLPYQSPRSVSGSLAERLAQVRHDRIERALNADSANAISAACAFEDLLDTVWKQERWARTEAHIDQELRLNRK